MCTRSVDQQNPLKATQRPPRTYLLLCYDRRHPSTYARTGTVSIRPGLPYPAFQVAPAAGALYWYTDVTGAALLPEEVKGRAQQEPGGKL